MKTERTGKTGITIDRETFVSGREIENKGPVSIGGLVDRSLLVARSTVKNRRGKKRESRGTQQQVRVEELLDPKGCNNGRRGGIERNSPPRFYSSASPIGESRYKGGTDRLENRCIAITSHFSFSHFFFSSLFSFSFSSCFFFFFFASDTDLSDQNDENVPCFRLNNRS